MRTLELLLVACSPPTRLARGQSVDWGRSPRSEARLASARHGAFGVRCELSPDALPSKRAAVIRPWRLPREVARTSEPFESRTIARISPPTGGTELAYSYDHGRKVHHAYSRRRSSRGRLVRLGRALAIAPLACGGTNGASARRAATAETGAPMARRRGSGWLPDDGSIGSGEDGGSTGTGDDGRRRKTTARGAATATTARTATTAARATGDGLRIVLPPRRRARGRRMRPRDLRPHRPECLRHDRRLRAADQLRRRAPSDRHVQPARRTTASRRTAACSAAGAQCGTIVDSCGVTINCGSCPSSTDAGASEICDAKTNQCVTCVPPTSADCAGKCGTITGCGESVDCGTSQCTRRRRATARRTPAAARRSRARARACAIPGPAARW